MADNTKNGGSRPFGWLNSTVLGIGVASLLSDWAHETATTVLPAFLATLGVAAMWLGLIEGVSDGLSSFAKLASGYYTDRLQRRKPVAVIGYLVTALGTASFGLASAAWHVLIARAVAWFGRGVRTPVRKALLAAAVTPQTYGRAFGFERMMDTFGAIAGPATAFMLLQLLHFHYPSLFAITLIPGILAAAAIGFLVKEKERKPVAYVSFFHGITSLPKQFKKFLAAVFLFGMGDFAPTLLILLAVGALKETMSPERAATYATALYLIRNAVYATFSMITGYLADRFRKNLLLSIGYGLGAVMVLMIAIFPLNLPLLGLVFVLSGVYVAMEETLEDSFCAELVDKSNHGMAFGSLATINGIGDFFSSFIVGALWTTFGQKIAFIYPAVLFIPGAILIYFIKPQVVGEISAAK
ncbi:MAG: MFS transporter [Verrucomicrobiia bacterium]